MISVAIPCYNSEKTVGVVVNDLVSMFKEHNDDYQIVLVNDGSKDGTFKEIRRLCSEDPNIVGVNLSKNYGQHSARMAAVPYLKGDYIVYMDDDGQHPVSEIHRMIDKLEEGDYDIVYAAFKKVKQTGFRRFVSRINTVTMNMLTGKPKDVSNSSFSVMRKYLLTELINYRSPFPSWTGFLMQVTRNIANVEIEQTPRLSGQSNYTIGKLLKLYSNGVMGFSTSPLKISSLTGSVIAILGFFVGIYSIIHKVRYPSVPMGYTSLIATILFTSGIMMLMLGIIGEYIGRTFMICSNMPQYSVKEVVNETKDADVKKNEC